MLWIGVSAKASVNTGQFGFLNDFLSDFLVV